MPSNKPNNLNEGIPDERGLDQEGRDAIQRRLDNSGKVPVVGNLRDLQLAGAEGAVHDSGPFKDISDLPKGVSKEDAVTPAEHDEARGLDTDLTS